MRDAVDVSEAPQHTHVRMHAALQHAIVLGAHGFAPLHACLRISVLQRSEYHVVSHSTALAKIGKCAACCMHVRACTVGKAPS